MDFKQVIGALKPGQFNDVARAVKGQADKATKDSQPFLDMKAPHSNTRGSGGPMGEPVEDRRGENGYVDPVQTGINNFRNNTSAINKVLSPNALPLPPAREGSLEQQAGVDDIPQYADGGGVDSTDDGDADDSGGGGAIPSVPQDDSTSAPDSMADGGGEDDSAQQPTPAPSTAAPIPNAPQAPNPVSELLALVRAINQYGLHIAQQQDAMGPQQGQQQQVQSYANGGVIRSFEDGGPTDDDPEAIPTAQPQQAPQQAPQDEQQGALPIPPEEPGSQMGEGQSPVEQGLRQGGDNSPWNRIKAANAPIANDIGNAVSKAGSAILDYFRGKHAMDGQTKAAIDYSNNKDGGLPGNVVAQKGVQSAYIKGLEQGGGDARSAADPARAYLQATRREYEMWRTAAAAKLHGGDMGQAIELANKAFSKGPFDTSLTFKTTRTGMVTGIVTDDKGNWVNQASMPAEQFASWLQSGAKFDSLVHDGVSQTLENHVTGGAQPSHEAQQNEFFQKYPANPQPTQQPQRAAGQPQRGQGQPTEQQLMAQAERIFPWHSQRQQRAQWVGQMLHQQASSSASEGRLQDRLSEANQRLAIQEAGRDRRQGITEEGKNKRQEYSWKQRLQLAHDRLSNGSAADKNKAFILRRTMDMHPEDNDAVRRELARQHLDYDELIGLGAGPAGQQKAPAQAGGQGGAGAPQGGAPGAAGQGGTRKTAKDWGLTTGQVYKGHTYTGGPDDDPSDKRFWK